MAGAVFGEEIVEALPTAAAGGSAGCEVRFISDESCVAASIAFEWNVTAAEAAVGEGKQFTGGPFLGVACFRPQRASNQLCRYW